MSAEIIPFPPPAYVEFVSALRAVQSLHARIRAIDDAQREAAMLAIERELGGLPPEPDPDAA